ncbi:MAG: CotH kinase family protein [Bacteroidaceae bacterium]|nr:CotH kinase family protein [Bacteroidaceae bacterium]
MGRNINKVFIFFIYCLIIKNLQANNSLPISQYDSLLRNIQTPLIEIWTTEGKEPTGEHITAPEELWGVGLINNEYVTGHMKVSLNGITLYESGEYIEDISGIRIRLRGNTSSYYWEKKPYKIKLSKKEDLLFRNDSKYKDKDWILLRVYDGFLTRFFTGNQLGKLIGLGWQPQWEYVNLVINGDYKGDYILIESVEKEKGRINIDDTGYIIEDDAYWWNEDIYFKGNILTYKTGYTFKYPDTDNINDSIINNIKNYILEFEELLVNNKDITSHIDLLSFAAWLLSQDILGQGDSGGTNRYLYKKDFDPANPFNTPLQMGVLWDFDATFKCLNTWSYIHNISYSFYFTKLLKRQDFYSTYITLWENIRSTLYDELISYLYDINQLKGIAINESRQINKQRWDDNNTILATEIEDAASWLRKRFEWINVQLQSDVESIEDLPTSKENNTQTIYDLSGRKMDSERTLQKGIYIINGNKVVIR